MLPLEGRREESAQRCLSHKEREMEIRESVIQGWLDEQSASGAGSKKGKMFRK